ncbi:hypothetical protein KM043_007016 [Ampulex compressa]|nr:hypothetical protein KM043_007016 [Ampulex compressa]
MRLSRFPYQTESPTNRSHENCEESDHQSAEAEEPAQIAALDVIGVAARFSRSMEDGGIEATRSEAKEKRMENGERRGGETGGGATAHLPAGRELSRCPPG